MFRIEFFVDDKHLAAVLHGLSSKAMNLSVVPVVNATAKNGTVKAETGGASLDLVSNWLQTQRGKQLRATDFREFAEGIGRKASSYQHFTRMAHAHKLIKKVSGTKGTGTRYTVVEG